MSSWSSRRPRPGVICDLIERFLVDAVDLDEPTRWDIEDALKRAARYYGWGLGPYGLPSISKKRQNQLANYGHAYDHYRDDFPEVWQRRAFLPETLDEFSQRRERQTKRGRPRKSRKLNDFQVTVFRFVVQLSKALNRDSKKRTAIPDPDQAIEKLAASLAVGTVPFVSLATRSSAITKWM